MNGSPRGGAPKGNCNAFKPGARRRSWFPGKAGGIKPDPPDRKIERLRNHAEAMRDGKVLCSPYGPGGVSVWNGRALRGQLKAMKRAQMRQCAKKLPDDVVGQSAERAICDVYDALCTEPKTFASGDAFLTRLRQLVLKDEMRQAAARLPSNIDPVGYLVIWEAMCAVLYACVWADPDGREADADADERGLKPSPPATEPDDRRTDDGFADRCRPFAIPIRAVPPPPVLPALPEPRRLMAERPWNGGLLRRELQARAKARRKTARHRQKAGNPVAAGRAFAACEVLRALCRGDKHGFASPLEFARAVLGVVDGMVEEARRGAGRDEHETLIGRKMRAQICIDLFDEICADRLDEEVVRDLLRTFCSKIEAMGSAREGRKAA